MRTEPRMNPRFLSEVPFTGKQIQREEQIGGNKVKRNGNLNFLPFRFFFLPMSEFFRSVPKSVQSEMGYLGITL